MRRKNPQELIFYKKKSGKFGAVSRPQKIEEITSATVFPIKEVLSRIGWQSEKKPLAAGQLTSVRSRYVAEMKRLARETNKKYRNELKSAKARMGDAKKKGDTKKYLSAVNDLGHAGQSLALFSGNVLPKLKILKEDEAARAETRKFTKSVRKGRPVENPHAQSYFNTKINLAFVSRCIELEALLNRGKISKQEYIKMREELAERLNISSASSDASFDSLKLTLQQEERKYNRVAPELRQFIELERKHEKLSGALVEANIQLGYLQTLKNAVRKGKKIKIGGIPVTPLLIQFALDEQIAQNKEIEKRLKESALVIGELRRKVLQKTEQKDYSGYV